MKKCFMKCVAFWKYKLILTVWRKKNLYLLVWNTITLIYVCDIGIQDIVFLVTQHPVKRKRKKEIGRHQVDALNSFWAALMIPDISIHKLFQETPTNNMYIYILFIKCARAQPRQRKFASRYSLFSVLFSLVTIIQQMYRLIAHFLS